MKNIALLQPSYPYGKAQVYLGGALAAVGAQLIDAGCDVEFFDLNITSIEDCWQSLEKATSIGITVIGSPYIPGVIELARKLAVLQTPVLIGGQVIAKLGQKEFTALFAGTNAVQIHDGGELSRALGTGPLKDPFQLSCIPMWERIPPTAFRAYLATEMTLIFSQGCHFQCVFCAAEKKQRESFKGVGYFEEDMRYLARKAKESGLSKLEFYATSLDFFQNPEVLQTYLQRMAEVREQTGVDIKVRCLACMSSFVKAHETIPDLKGLLARAGVWCVGFGVDGLDSLVWLAEKKYQNKTLEQVWSCLHLAEDLGLRAEALLVMGFPGERPWKMLKYLSFAFKASFRCRNIMLRPYLAKPQVPGNDHWGVDNPQREIVREPERLKNLDFCAIGSPDTDKDWWHRTCANAVYLLICGVFGPLGKCCTSPLMSTGSHSLWNRFAKVWNQTVPFDR